MYRIAIASSNGENVDLHFAQAESFLIYEITKDGVDFIDDRPVVLPEKEHVHNEENMDAVIELLNDCVAVFVLKIGMRSSRQLYARGLKSFEVSYPLHHIFRTLVDNLQRGKIKVL